MGKYFLLALASLSVSAFANISIVCGGKVNSDGWMDKPVFTCGSEDDNFFGHPGDAYGVEWQGKKFEGADAKDVDAVTVGGDGNKRFIFKVTEERDNSGKRTKGVDLVVTEPYDDKPTLHVSPVGSSRVQAKTLKCVSSVD